ncbi:hypothetical protein Q8A67_016995 [Cirrhinus molitorella]|uniref:Uncharacterized protein n=1 Tax=Cirrhinus molitorella TaxID=172907 RepID=A0AA88TLA6_9TELE|nr:hypothetical protein Q8A67_016995 [Cirrhinus molitorella]
MNHSKAYKCLDRRDCEQIRVFSRRSWEKHALQCERSATTYAAEHPQKTLDEPTAGRARPCSPTRRHRPHPTRSLYAIKELPRNPQTTAGACYQINSYLHQALCSYALPECVPAVNHWLRRATEQDVQLLERMLKNFSDKR